MFVPFVYFGAKDMAFHFRGRKVSITEHVLHLGIGLTQAMLFVQALRGNVVLMFVALGMFLVTGSIDEYTFHRFPLSRHTDSAKRRLRCNIAHGFDVDVAVIEHQACLLRAGAFKQSTLRQKVSDL